jgi:Activator of Hsp90 ATPase homolog 1-like protein
MQKLSIIVALFFYNSFTYAQEIKNTSYITQTGERVLRLEMTVPLDRAKAWELFTIDSEIKKWMAPSAHIELKTGGYIVTNYDTTKSLSDPSSIRLGIINYIENEMLTLKVKLNNNFSSRVQNEDGNLQEIIQLKDAGNGNTNIISSMIGWGTGPDWDKTYSFFEKGNTWTYEQMDKLFQ